MKFTEALRRRKFKEDKMGVRKLFDQVIDTENPLECSNDDLAALALCDIALSLRELVELKKKEAEATPNSLEGILGAAMNMFVPKNPDCPVHGDHGAPPPRPIESRWPASATCATCGCRSSKHIQGDGPCMGCDKGCAEFVLDVMVPPPALSEDIKP